MRSKNKSFKLLWRRKGFFRRRLHSFTRRQRFAYDVGQQIRLSGKSFKVYGSDPAVKDVTENESKINASALLGFFGMKQQNSAFVALITKGDTIASVDSVQKSSGDKYDRAGTSYTITDVSYVGSGSKMTKYVGTQYSGEINVCYRFLTNKNASYSGMAIACREQLIRNSVLSTRTVTSSAHLPFALTILATAQKAAADASALQLMTRHTTFSICSRQKA